MYSRQLDKHYIGESHDLEKRLAAHKEAKYDSSFTMQTKDWEIIWSFECDNRSLALKIEQLIKNRKIPIPLP